MLHRTIILATILLFPAGCALAEPKTVPAKNFELSPAAMLPTVLRWTLEPWKGDDTPYRKLRKEIDAALAGGASPQALAVKYKLLHSARPSDPVAQFGWSYATYRWTMASPRRDRFGLLKEVFDAQRKAPYQETYEQARLRFLIETQSPHSPYLKEVGERLLAKNPDDYEVKLKFLNVLQLSPSKVDLEKSLVIAKELVKQKPRDATARAALASVYMDFFGRFKDKADADRSIALYNQYLKLAPPDAEFRKGAQYWIEYLQSGGKSHKLFPRL